MKKCNICDVIIEEEDVVTLDDLCERVDFYGMESLTENEQAFLEGHICVDCIL